MRKDLRSISIWAPLFLAFGTVLFMCGTVMAAEKSIPALMGNAPEIWADISAKFSPHENRHLRERKKINYLISRMKGSPHSFIREGEIYTGKQAAAHLGMKYRNDFGRVTTAREFVDSIASRSSLSGSPYQIRTPEGLQFPARKVFLHDLGLIEAAIAKFEEVELAKLTRDERE